MRRRRPKKKRAKKKAVWILQEVSRRLLFFEPSRCFAVSLSLSLSPSLPRVRGSLHILYRPRLADLVFPEATAPRLSQVCVTRVIGAARRTAV